MVKIKKIGEIAEVKGGKRLPKGSALVEKRNNHPYLRVVDFSDGTIDESKLLYVPDKIFPKIARYTISSNDIYISIAGTVGLVGIVPKYLDGASLTENAAKICNLSNTVNQKYLTYYLKSNEGQAAIRSLTVGSTQPKLALFRIKDIEFPTPPISEQNSIASILSALDDKIENNKKMNETLEEMARTIFKSWFVNFDPVQAKATGNTQAHMDTETASLFPNSFGDDGLPSGWKKIYLSDLTNIVYGKNLPTKQLVTSGYPVFGGNGVIGFHSEYLYEEPQVLVACRGAASGKVIRSLPFSFVTNNSLVIEITNPHLNRFFLELYLKDLTLEGFTTGSAQPQMTINNMDAVKLLYPTKEILNCFQTVVKPYFDKVFKNDEENKTLAELRDTLLPKLMSGEICVKDAEREVEAAV